MLMDGNIFITIYPGLYIKHYRWNKDVFWKVVICLALSTGRQNLVDFVESNGPRAEFVF